MIALGETQQRFEPPSWAQVASLSVHAALLALALLLSQVKPYETPPPPPAIDVDLLPAPVAARPAQAVREAAPTKTSSVPAATKSSPAATSPSAAPLPAKSADGLTHVKPSFAASFLHDPAGQRLAKKFSTLADSEKITQLCNMEGTEQIRHAMPSLNPDMIVPYAFGDADVQGLTEVADSAAVHSGSAWYALRLHCTASSDLSGVTDFAFSVGAVIPKADWTNHNLPATFDAGD